MLNPPPEEKLFNELASIGRVRTWKPVGSISRIDRSDMKNTAQLLDLYRSSVLIGGILTRMIDH